MVLLAPGVDSVGSAQGDGDVEGLASDAAEGVEDSLVKGAGKGALLIGRQDVSNDSALLGSAQVSPPAHPFSYLVEEWEERLLGYVWSGKERGLKVCMVYGVVESGTDECSSDILAIIRMLRK